MRLTRRQQEFFDKYRKMTNIEPVYVDDVENGTLTFDNVARLNINRFVQNTSETADRLRGALRDASI